MYELIFTPIDMIYFTIGGMALGFVIGAKLMKWTMRVHYEVKQNPEQIIRDLLRVPLPDDGGESFHEECGDR